MRSTPFQWSLIILSTLFTFSCTPDTDLFTEPTPVAVAQYANVDERLWEHFAAFEAEGAERGFTIDLNRAAVSGTIEEIDEEHVAGQCTYSSREPNHVTVDASFWENASSLFREFIIFHELGHCFLGRDHEEGKDERGVCLSIMRSGVEDCFDNYRTSTRADYLDELFASKPW